MRDLKLTLVQADQAWENKEANLRRYESLLSSIPQTDLILLPEMFHTGFSMDAAILAEDMSGSAVMWLKPMAQKLQSAIYTSFICSEGGEYFNRGIFVYPGGEYQTYDKRKRFGMAGETGVYQSGKDEVIVNYLDWKISLQICYDLRFPEIVRNRLLPDGTAAYDLLLYVANWPQRRVAHWDALLRARAIENQCYVAGCNRVGTDGDQINYSGSSQIIDPAGEIAVSNSGDEVVMHQLISAQRLNDVRQHLPFLKDSEAR